MWRRNRAVFALVVWCVPAWAHVVSISNGELHVTSRNATYELRIPAYEVENMATPETTLLNEIRFGGAARTSAKCTRDPNWLVCDATYTFAADVPDKVDVECTLYRVTVPNHVHILYVEQGGNSDQRTFDQGSPSGEMRFHPPSFSETLARDGSAGALRLLGSVAALLFLAGLALAARTWRELALLGLTFVAAEWAVRPVAPFIPIALPPEFLEAVLALTAAYIAAELAFLRQAGARWVLAPLFGLLHGLPFAPFPALYMAGAVAAQILVFVLIGFGALRLPAAWRTRTTAAVLGTALASFAFSLLK
jgi:hypothetical protein